MSAHFALKVIGQRLAAYTFATRPRHRRGGGHIGGAFVGLQIFQAQFELFDLAIKRAEFVGPGAPARVSFSELEAG